MNKETLSGLSPLILYECILLRSGTGTWKPHTNATTASEAKAEESIKKEADCPSDAHKTPLIHKLRTRTQALMLNNEVIDLIQS